MVGLITMNRIKLFIHCPFHCLIIFFFSFWFRWIQMFVYSSVPNLQNICRGLYLLWGYARESETGLYQWFPNRVSYMVSSTFTIAHSRTRWIDLSLFSFLSTLSDGNNVCVFFFRTWIFNLLWILRSRVAWVAYTRPRTFQIFASLYLLDSRNFFFLRSSLWILRRHYRSCQCS